MTCQPVTATARSRCVACSASIVPDAYPFLLQDNTFKVLIDNEVVKEGSMLEEFEPPINPPEQIDDPEDSKPEDWVDEAQVCMRSPTGGCAGLVGSGVSAARQ